MDKHRITYKPDENIPEEIMAAIHFGIECPVFTVHKLIRKKDNKPVYAIGTPVPDEHLSERERGLINRPERIFVIYVDDESVLYDYEPIAGSEWYTGDKVEEDYPDVIGDE